MFIWLQVPEQIDCTALLHEAVERHVAFFPERRSTWKIHVTTPCAWPSSRCRRNGFNKALQSSGS